MCDSILLNSFWVEKFSEKNQNTHLMLHRFFPETVAFIELLQEIQQTKWGQRNSCLPVDFVMLHNYHLHSTVYICTVKSQHSTQIWTHSHLCSSFVCDGSIWPCAGRSVNGREDCSSPSQLTCFEKFFTNIHWPYVGYPCVTSVTVCYETYF